VPVQHVQLVQRHPVDQFLDVGDALEMPRRVEHQATPLETRVIGDHALRDRRGHSARGARSQQLPERDAAVEQTAWRTCRHPNVIVADVDAVTRLAHGIGMRVQLEHDRRRRPCTRIRRELKVQATRRGDEVHEALRDRLRLCTVAVRLHAHARPVAHRHRPLRGLSSSSRLRNQRPRKNRHRRHRHGSARRAQCDDGKNQRMDLVHAQPPRHFPFTREALEPPFRPSIAEAHSACSIALHRVVAHSSGRQKPDNEDQKLPALRQPRVKTE